MSASACSTKDCAWMDNDKFCRMLQQNKVPIDDKWPLLILQLRGVGHDPTFSPEQKKKMQTLLIDIIKAQSFTNDSYTAARKKLMQIIAIPFDRKVQDITAEVEAIAQDAGMVLNRHKRDVMNVADTVDKDLASGKEPRKALTSLRATLKEVLSTFEEDTTRFKQLSNRDCLTGTANRRCFDAYVNDSVNLWVSSDVPAALMLFDIDHFKGFNDKYGHLVGDQVLSALASMLMKAARSMDSAGTNTLVARFGGDEFAIIVRGDLAGQSAVIGEKIRAKVADTALLIRDAQGQVIENKLHVTISMGVALLSRSYGNDYVQALIDNADKALYHAKLQGRNCVVHFTGDKKNMFKRMTPTEPTPQE